MPSHSTATENISLPNTGLSFPPFFRFFFIMILIKGSMHLQQFRQPKKVYTNQWAIQIEGGQQEEAEALASKYGFRNLGPVS